ncbi:MAG: hypothetical protein BRD44_04885, partial [Bacteroidetes bacterium QS_7_67_15]
DAAAADTSADGEGEETAPLLIDLDEHRLLLWAYLLDKALYEVRYELNHRPSWMGVPLRGLKRLLSNDEGRGLNDEGRSSNVALKEASAESRKANSEKQASMSE